MCKQNSIKVRQVPKIIPMFQVHNEQHGPGRLKLLVASDHGEFISACDQFCLHDSRWKAFHHKPNTKVTVSFKYQRIFKLFFARKYKFEWICVIQ